MQNFWKDPPLHCIIQEEYEIQQTTAVSKQRQQITPSVLIVTTWWWMMMCPENSVRNILPT